MTMDGDILVALDMRAGKNFEEFESYLSWLLYDAAIYKELRVRIVIKQLKKVVEI